MLMPSLLATDAAPSHSFLPPSRTAFSSPALFNCMSQCCEGIPLHVSPCDDQRSGRVCTAGAHLPESEHACHVKLCVGQSCDGTATNPQLRYTCPCSLSGTSHKAYSPETCCASARPGGPPAAARYPPRHAQAAPAAASARKNKDVTHALDQVKQCCASQPEYCKKDAGHLQVHVLLPAIGKGGLRFQVFVAPLTKRRTAPISGPKALDVLLI